MILGASASRQALEPGGGLVYRCELPAVARCTWAWIADTHVKADPSASARGQRPDFRLRRIAAEIAADPPAGVLVNGDLAWSVGAESDYDRLLAILRPLATRSAVVLGVGNHDSRGNLLAALRAETVPEPARLTAVVDQPPFRFVALDSLADRRDVGGELGTVQIEWLESVLSEAPDRRAILFVHHPGRSKSAGCRDFAALERLAARHRSVQAIVTGHDHEFSLDRAGGVHRVGLPATGFAFEPETPCGWVEARLSEACLDLRLRAAAHAARHVLAWRDRDQSQAGALGAS